MPSNYEEFYIMKRDANGVLETMESIDVTIYDVGTNASVGSATSDSNGLIAAGTVSVAAGSRLRFRVENEDGLAGSVTQIST